MQEGLETLAPYIEDLPGDSGLDATTKKEVISRLTRVADTIQDDATADNGSGSVAMRVVSRVIRTHVPMTPPPAHLTEGEIATMVDAILDRVFVYSQYTGQTNQLRQEVIRLKGHPDEGMVLRSLYDALQAYEELNSQGALVPDFRLSLLVRAGIRGLRDAQID